MTRDKPLFSLDLQILGNIGDNVSCMKYTLCKWFLDIYYKNITYCAFKSHPATILSGTHASLQLTAEGQRERGCTAVSMDLSKETILSSNHSLPLPPTAIWGKEGRKGRILYRWINTESHSFGGTRGEECVHVRQPIKFMSSCHIQK